MAGQRVWKVPIINTQGSLKSDAELWPRYLGYLTFELGLLDLAQQRIRHMRFWVRPNNLVYPSVCGSDNGQLPCLDKGFSIGCP